jgi:hypothetical protein
VAIATKANGSLYDCGESAQERLMGLLVDNGRSACGIAVSGGCSQAWSGPILLCTELDDDGQVSLHLDMCVWTVLCDCQTQCLIFVADARHIVHGRAHVMRWLTIKFTPPARQLLACEVGVSCPDVQVSRVAPSDALC